MLLKNQTPRSCIKVGCRWRIASRFQEGYIFFTCQLNKHLHNEMQLEMKQKYTKHKKICDKVAEVDSFHSSK